MKRDDILDAIGNVDDACVKRAKEKKKSHKKVWITLGSLAACLLVVFMLPGIILNFGGYDSADNVQDEEIAVEYKNVWIYYVEDGQICKAKEYTAMQASSIFALWKEKNGIGDEVELIKFRIESNSSTTTSEYDGEGIVKHEVGDYRVLKITVSANLEAYYETIDSELLLESLKQTMTGYSNLEYDEYNLYFE